MRPPISCHHNTSLTLRVAALALIIVFFQAGRADAQVLYGSVIGTVLDQSGAVVPSAGVSIVSTTTGAQRQTSTDEAGRYSLLNVLPGAYDLRASAAGFRTTLRADVNVRINAVTRVDVELKLGALAEEVTVTAPAVTLNTDRSDVSSEIGTDALVNLPLPAYRNYQSLLDLVPGTTPSQQTPALENPMRPTWNNINGTARNHNNTLVDGAVNIFIWQPQHTIYVPPAESIESVSVATGSFDAEQGLAGGAAITLNTKSGTNNLHGAGFWFHDNQHLKARPYFYWGTSARPPLPKGIYNMTGGALGGPVVRNRLFLFADFERTMERNGLTKSFSVPPADIRTGDFSAYTALSLIYDPATGSPDGTGRLPFPGNTIPRDRISSIFQNIQALAPLPNQPAIDTWGFSGNYGRSGVSSMGRDNWDLKINWNPASRLSVWGKYSRMDGVVAGPAGFGELTGPGLSYYLSGTGDTTVQMPSLGYVYTFSPTLIVDGVFGYTRFDQSVYGPDFGKNWGTEIWRIPGTNGGTQYANDSRYSGQPGIYGHGFDWWGNALNWEPLFRNDRTYTYTTNLSNVRKAHELRLGFEIRRHHMDHWQPETGNPRGLVTFNGAPTMIKGGSIRTTNSYAAALLGLVQSYSKSVQFFLMTNREWQLAWYVRDRWQVTRNLTLNLGLRYEYYPLLSRIGRGIERWDPVTNLVYLGGVGNVPRSNGLEASRRLFAPRVGFAYRLGNKTVIRSGYGITYDPMPLSRPLRGLYPATITASWVALHQYGYFNTIAEGLPAVPTPDVGSGVVTLPLTVNMGRSSPWGGMLHRGYIQSWNFTVQRKLPGDMVGSLGYVGNQTVHQLGDRNINAAAPGTGNAGRPLYVTQGRLIDASMWDGWMSGNYHSSQATLSRQMQRGLYLQGSYTWGKAINMTDEDGWATLGLINWEPAIKRNRARAGYDREHMFIVSWVYELPFGKGRKWNLRGPADAMLGGWAVAGVFSAYTGFPFTVNASDVSLNAPGNSQTADQVKSEVLKIGDVGPGTAFYDPTAFRDPNFQRPANVYRFGTTGRSILSGPGFIRPNVGVHKSLLVAERVKVQFRAEAFNLSNTPQFSNPGANVSSVQYAADGSIRNLNNFMAITAASGERQFRFGLRVSF